MPFRRPHTLTNISVAVIGAGPGGICMGVGLRRAGVERFTIYEQSTDIGGTWWDSRYPGAAVDTAQPLYSFSFAPYDFTRTHVGRDELLEYLHNTAAAFHLRDNLRLNCRIDRVVWDDIDCAYTVYAADGSAEKYDVVVSAVGLLNNPRYPDWPGLEGFEGEKFHSARWNADIELTDRVVAVVGTGSSAAQIVPAIAPVAKALHVYQRQPGWVAPKGDRTYDASERGALLHPVGRRIRRARQIIEYEKLLRSARVDGTDRNLRAREICLDYIASIFAARPDLAAAVTPNYPYGGKRVVQENGYYPTFLRDNVELVPHEVKSVTPSGIVNEIGEERAADVLIMCTGFTAAEFLATLDVTGKHGRTLREVWDGEPFALLGLMVPGFPNFYMLYGPNTNGGPIMYFHERQVNFVIGNIRRMARQQIDALEVRQGLTRVFNAVLQKRLERMVITRYHVHGYAFSRSGRQVITWSEGLTAYWLLTRLLRPLACRASASARGIVVAED